jgi:hypothetical protein
MRFHVGHAHFQHVHLGLDRRQLAAVHGLGDGVAVTQRDLARRKRGVLHELSRRCAFPVTVDVDDRAVGAVRPVHAALLRCVW